MSQRQANVRLDDELFERIEVAAFKNRRSFAEEMRVALAEHVEREEEDPRFATAMGARVDLPVDEAADVHSIAEARKGAQKRNA